VRKSVLKILWTATALLLPALALAWNPFASADEFQEMSFSAAELAQVQVQAGWAKGEDHTLLFEVHNGLKGPIQCASAQVDLQDGKRVSKVFTPKLFVPPQSTRNANIPQVHKGSMKSYAMSCSCFKKQGKGECVNPLRKG